MHELEENLSAVYVFICIIAILLAIYLCAALSILRNTVRESISLVLGRTLQPLAKDAGKPSTGSSAAIHETGTTH